MKLAIALICCLLSQPPLSTKILHLPDETSLVRLKADPTSLLDEEINVCGGIEISDYFNFAYNNYEFTHFAFRFKEAGQTLKDIGVETCYLYAPKTDEWKKVVDELVKHAEQDKNATTLILCRVRVKLRAGAYFHGKQWNMLDLVDIQFSEADFKKWTPWILDVEKRQKEAEAKEKADRIAADKVQERINAARLEVERERLAIEGELKRALEIATWRDWQDPKGATQSVKYAGISNGKVRLLTEDGTAFRVPIKDLPKDLQEWVNDKPWIELQARIDENSGNKPATKPKKKPVTKKPSRDD